ncbi:MAG: LytTR family DNA-binding domain-containing protein [Ekhidna sp.]
MNTALIVDDEPLARKRIKKLLREYQSIRLVAESGDYHDAVRLIDEERPDILFLDIQLKTKKGFDILENIDHLPLVVFTTAYSDYAIKAFDYHAIDYLLKPFNDERFHKSVSRALHILEQGREHWKTELKQLLHTLNENRQENYIVRVPVRMGDRTYFVSADEIAYIKASAYYAELFVNGKKHVIRESLTNLMTSLNPSVFIRIHRSSIININFIREVVAIGFGDLELKMMDGEQLRVSKTYKERLVKELGIK